MSGHRYGEAGKEEVDCNSKNKNPHFGCGELRQSHLWNVVDFALTWPPERSTAVDPPPAKGQRQLIPSGLLQKPKTSAKVLPLSEAHADEDHSRTRRGCLPPPMIPGDNNARKCNQNVWSFIDFEMALNALGKLPTVA